MERVVKSIGSQAGLVADQIDDDAYLIPYPKKIPRQSVPSINKSLKDYQIT